MTYKSLIANALKSELVTNANFVGEYDFPMLKKTTSIPKRAVPFNCISKSTDRH